MPRPRLLLVPTTTEVEWGNIRPLFEEWADVASFDIPGVGDEPPVDELTPEAISARGAEEVRRQGWDSCVVVGDEAGAASAVRLAATHPELVDGLALGHATVSYRRTGPRPAVNGDISDALAQMAHTDYRSFVRALAQTTQHAYDEEFVQEYMRRVPQDLAAGFVDVLLVRADTEDVGAMLHDLDVPLLLVEHRGCLMWTSEGFEDAVAAFPDAKSASLDVKPSVDPEFANLLRNFCAGLG